MKINPGYYEYAKKLSVLGDRIIVISNKFTDMKLDTPEKIQIHYDNCLSAITEYKELKLAIMLTVVPKIVEKEHEELIEGYQIYTSGTDLMFNAIDIGKRTIDMAMTIKGFALQEKGKNMIVEIAKRIGDKLLGE